MAQIIHDYPRFPGAHPIVRNMLIFAMQSAKPPQISWSDPLGNSSLGTSWSMKFSKQQPIVIMVKLMLLLAFFYACPHLELGGYHRVPLVEFSAWTVPST